MGLAENSLLSFNPEAAYGTYIETGQVSVPVETLTPQTDPTLAERADMDGDIFELTACPTRKARTVAWAGKVYPDSTFGYLLNNMLGAAVTSGAGDDKTHVWFLQESELLQRSLCAEITEADNTADNYDGIEMSTLTISGTNDGYVQYEVNGFSQGRASGTKQTPIVLPSICPLRYNNAVVNWNSGEIKVDSWSITIDLQLRGDNFKSGNDEIQRPVLNGRPMITAQFEIDNADRTYRTDFEAGTATKQFKVVITSADTIAATGNPYVLTFELPVTQITENSLSGETGQKKESVSLKGFVGTSEGTNTTNLEVTLINAATSYT